MSKITMKSTKQEIMEAYEEAMKKLQNLNPVKMIR